MALESTKRIGELQEWSKKLGIDSKVTPSKKNGKFCKEDYIVSIRDYFLEKRYGSLNSIPEELKMRMYIKSPMLAERFDNIKEEYQKEIIDSEDWGFEEKLNGVRCIVVNIGNGLHIYSRHSSDVDLIPVEFTNNVRFPDNCDLSKLKTNFVFDCEMTCDSKNISTEIGKYGVTTDTELSAVVALMGMTPQKSLFIQERENIHLVFNIFDCIYYDKSWIMNEPWFRRRELTLQLIQELRSCNFNAREVTFTNTNKMGLYKSLISVGKEGCVCKNRNGIYIPDNTRGVKGWIKIKRSMSEMGVDSDYGDTIDAWISGYIPGNKGTEFENLVGVVCVSVYLRCSDGTLKEHEIARFSGISLDLRKDMTEIIGGEPTLKASYYNRVVEIDGQSVSARERRLNHAVFVTLRNEKNKEDCILEEDFLNSMIL